MGLLAAWLAGLVFNLIVTYVRSDVDLRAGMALGAFYVAIAQILGWWLVVWLVRRR